MAQPRLHAFGFYPLLNPERGRGMPQIVQGEARRFRRPQERLQEVQCHKACDITLPAVDGKTRCKSVGGQASFHSLSALMTEVGSGMVLRPAADLGEPIQPLASAR